MGTSAVTHLASVDAAITAVLSGKVSSYSIQSRSLSYLPLSELFKIRTSLLTEIDLDAGDQNSFSLAKLGKASQ